MKKLATWWREFDDENEKLVEENKMLKNEKLEHQRSNAKLIKENENHKKRFQKLNEKEQKVSVEKIQRRLNQITADNEKLDEKKDKHAIKALKRDAPHVQNIQKKDPREFLGENLLETITEGPRKKRMKQ